jgi:hypothetical protein
MATEIANEISIAAGHNNAAGFVVVSNLTTSGIAFVAPKTLPRSNRGERKVATSGISRFSGKRYHRWQSSILWIPQYPYLVTTYEGAVTIRTLFDSLTYANYNAYLYCGELNDYAGKEVNESLYGLAVPDFIWYFEDVVAI